MTTTPQPRVLHDSMGALDVPNTALWGAQTQRAIQNFPATGRASAAGQAAPTGHSGSPGQ